MFANFANWIYEIMRRSLLLLQCYRTFSFGWLSFYKDAITMYKNKHINSEIHHVQYKGRTLYYRTNTTDIILIICILVKNVLYNIGFDKINPKGVYDLGANIGLFSFKFADKYPDVRFVAVEPEDDNYKMLELNLCQFPNVITAKNGIWWRNSNLEIIDRGSGSWAFQVVEKETGEIEGRSIDNLIESFDIPANIVKMDIEGSEMPIFQHINDSKWLKDNNLFICEVHESFNPGVDKLVRDIMHKYGFKECKQGESYVFIRNTRSYSLCYNRNRFVKFLKEFWN